MHFGLASYAISFLAGTLSTLSPCVLPIIPILLGSATSSHRHGPLALGAGLVISYAVIGTALASAGSVLGVDGASLRLVGAAILATLGLFIMSSTLQQRFATATAGIGAAGNNFLTKITPQGLGGQLLVGLVLGVVWSPCVGPTLGAAIVLASQGSSLLKVGATMTAFGIGAAVPVMAIGQLSRRTMQSSRGSLLKAGRAGKAVMGAGLLLVALLILTGLDKALESAIVDLSPAWLTALTTKF